MKHKDDVWGWMLAVDFFLAGMGGAMLVIAGLTHFIWGIQQISILAAIAAPIFISMGAGLLILELGRPFQGWRVFIKPKAILTIGAWNMLLAIGFGFLYASCFIPGIPWKDAVSLQNISAGLSAFTGLVVAIYPGILLGRHKARPFWTGPGMVVLFFTSSLVTGFAAHQLSDMIVRPAEGNITKYLPWAIAILLIFQVIIWFSYLFVKYSGTTEREQKSILTWVTGDLSILFWIGFAFLGTLLPFILTLTGRFLAVAIADILIIAGGALMRWMVIHAGGERTWLPGEEIYRKRLPQGNELFLKSWK